MSNKPFLFKKFSVNQDRCAMKIGTDGVLLGAWTSISQNPFSVLDIGAGTGVISLMLAQRCYAELIDAIEIDANAYEQCTENFENSPWNDRLFCYHASVKEFAQEIDDEYDFPVCHSNPTIMNFNSGYIKFMRKIKDSIIKVIPSKFMRPLIDVMIQLLYKKPMKLDPKVRNQLYVDFFQKDTRKLEHYYGIDLSIWNA